MFLEPGGYIQWEDAESAWCFQNNIFIGILEVETNSFEYFIQALLKFVFLEPGGYIQWEDADLVHQVIKGDTAHELEQRLNEIFKRIFL
jgi:hypothetical protein